MASTNPLDHRCPLCKQIDMVQKVNAVVESGTHAGMYANTAGVQVSGVSLSTKAAQLVAPPMPILESSWGCVSIGGLLALVCSVVFWVSGVFYALSTSFCRANPSCGYNDQVSFAIICSVCAIFSFAGIIAIIMAVTAKARRNKTRHELDLSRWRRAKSIWNELYYCHRHDVVFRPGFPGAYAPASQMYRLL